MRAGPSSYRSLQRLPASHHPPLKLPYTYSHSFAEFRYRKLAPHYRASVPHLVSVVSLFFLLVYKSHVEHPPPYDSLAFFYYADVNRLPHQYQSKRSYLFSEPFFRLLLVEDVTLPTFYRLPVPMDQSSSSVGHIEMATYGHSNADANAPPSASSNQRILQEHPYLILLGRRENRLLGSLSTDRAYCCGRQ